MRKQFNLLLLAQITKFLSKLIQKVEFFKMTFNLIELDEKILKCRDAPLRDILKSCHQGYYVNNNSEKVLLTDIIYHCLSNTVYFEANHEFTIPPLTTKLEGRIEIRKETTIQATYRMVVKENRTNVCALNFGNAFRPGGNVLSGAKAQEESLCRASALYYSLLQEQASQFYKNHVGKGPTSSNALIYTPDCPAWKGDFGNLDKPYTVSFITSAAVNNNGFVDKQTVKNIQNERIKQIIKCAIAIGVKNFVLGAFGCGMFRNDPVDIAQSFKKYLVDDEMRFYFDSISFSIFDTVTSDNASVFSEVFNIPITPKRSEE